MFITVLLFGLEIVIISQGNSNLVKENFYWMNIDLEMFCFLQDVIQKALSG